MTEDQYDQLMATLTALVIVQSRTYDAILMGLSEEDREHVMSYHEAGDLMGPEIRLVGPDDTEQPATTGSEAVDEPSGNGRE